VRSIPAVKGKGRPATVVALMMLTLIPACSEAPSRLGAPGTLDPSFGHGGTVTTRFRSGPALASAVEIGEDAGIVVAGGAGFDGTDSREEGDFAVARYRPDGALDTTFGSAGRVTTDFASRNDTATDLALLEGGRILVVGRATVEGVDFALARYGSDGTLDDTFGFGGTVVTDLKSGDEGANAIGIQRDGSIVAVGIAIRSGQGGDVALARYEPDGSLDPSFGSAGIVITPTNSVDDEATAVAIQENGDIVVAGFARKPGGPADFIVARYRPNGSPDTAFGNGGRVTADFGAGAAAAYGVEVQEDGKIVAVGGLDILRDDEMEDRQFAVARYHPDGTLDPGFGSGGRVTTDFGLGAAGSLDVAIQEDGRILCVGAVGPNPDEARFALARYNPDGSLDRQFGHGGNVTTDFGPGPDEARALAIGNNAMVVVGSRSIDTRDRRFAVARYLI
jgi:uncharacterized delta-60 repeat protein